VKEYEYMVKNSVFFCYRSFLKYNNISFGSYELSKNYVRISSFNQAIYQLKPTNWATLRFMTECGLGLSRKYFRISSSNQAIYQLKPNAQIPNIRLPNPVLKTNSSYIRF